MVTKLEGFEMLPVDIMDLTASESIYDPVFLCGPTIESALLGLYTPKTVWQCDECAQIYDEEEQAEECCETTTEDKKVQRC